MDMREQKTRKWVLSWFSAWILFLILFVVWGSVFAWINLSSLNNKGNWDSLTSWERNTLIDSIEELQIEMDDLYEVCNVEPEEATYLITIKYTRKIWSSYWRKYDVISPLNSYWWYSYWDTLAWSTNDYVSDWWSETCSVSQRFDCEFWDSNDCPKNYYWDCGALADENTSSNIQNWQKSSLRLGYQPLWDTCTGYLSCTSMSDSTDGWLSSRQNAVIYVDSEENQWLFRQDYWQWNSFPWWIGWLTTSNYDYTSRICDCDKDDTVFECDSSSFENTYTTKYPPSTYPTHCYDMWPNWKIRAYTARWSSVKQ